MGVESSYCDLNGQQKLAWLQQARTDGAARIDRPRESSCIGYVMECVQSYYESAGEADRFREIQRRVVGDDSRGTTLLQELQTDGWQLLYFNERPAPGPGESNVGWSFATQVDSGLPYLHGAAPHDDGSSRAIHPDHLLWDYPNTGLGNLNDVPFFVGLSDAGNHTWVGFSEDSGGTANAVVSELHWAMNPALRQLPVLERYDRHSAGNIPRPKRHPDRSH